MRSGLWILLLTSSLCAENWPGWRGPRGDGTSRERGLPLSWSNTENVAWKTSIPGEGHSSPVIWNDTVFLTTYIEADHSRRLLSLNRQTGEVQWEKTVLKASPETIHRLNSRASGTPATDGRQVYVAFMRPEGDLVMAPNVGSERLITPGRVIMAAYDMNGRRQWRKEVGNFVSAHGFNSSPVLHEDLVILNGDHDGEGYLVALDRNDGKERWRIRRDHDTRSYVTPLIRRINGRTQMVLSGSHAVCSYDPLNGQRHWKLSGPTEQFVASMVFNGDYFFLTCGYPDKHILAIDPDGSGDLSDDVIAWRTNRGAAYVPSPLLAGPYLFVVADSGIASCFDADTGDRHWMERLPGGHSASPVTADGHLYFVSDRGVTSILKADQTFQVVAKNELSESVSASPAISQGQIFIRTHQHLYCLGQ